MKVDFVIAGTQKGGTSALDEYLREHPRICMAKRKEVHFFDKEKFFAAPRPDYAPYHAFFRRPLADRLLRRPPVLYGEATPIYMYWREVPQRIYEYNPAMKIIVTLRNPIERAYSHWNMERMRGRDEIPFGEAIRREAERCREALPLQHRVFSYVDRGFYVAQLQRIWSYFPQEQTLILRSDRIKSDPVAVLGRICAFLGVPPLPVIQAKDVHVRPYEAPMDPADWAYLHDVFEPEIRNLEQLLNWDCSDWLRPRTAAPHRSTQPSGTGGPGQGVS